MLLSRRLLTAALILGLAPGCGAIRFKRAWARHETPPGATLLEGRWQGTWSSEWNGHSGRLRCIVTAGEPGRFEAWFYSNYSLFFFQYRTELTATGTPDGRLTFEGQEDLGSMAGGLYRYDGAVDGDAFHATFTAENGDHGVFEMMRVQRPEEP
jgi:hypothetical protein